MRKSLIPNFLFYPCVDNSKIIKDNFFLFKEKVSEIVRIKKNVNIFFSFYNFTLIYFYIGNFFIKNKLKKTLKNLFDIGNDFYILSNSSLNFSDNLKFFLEQTIKLKKYNIDKIVLKLNNKFYLFLDIINLAYHYYLILVTFLIKYNFYVSYLNMSLIQKFYILNNRVTLSEVM